MTHDHDHDTAAELLGAYALDALDPEEAALVHEHVQGCPRCQDELTGHHRVAAMLGNIGEGADAALWEAIERRLAPRESSSPSAADLGRADPDGPGSDPVASGPGRILSFRPHGRNRRIGRAVVGLAAAFALGLLSFQVVHLDGKGDGHRSAVSGLTKTADTTAAGVRRVVLTSTDQAGHEVAEIVTTTSGSATLYNRGLPQLPSSRTYQLWALVDGQMISAGLLGAHPTTAAFTLNPAEPTTAFAITVEPAHGSISPTSTPVATTTV